MAETDSQLKEQDIVNLLSDWLYGWGFNVYQNHKNDHYGVFSVKGESKQKPDLIITPRRSLPLKCILEVKPAHMSDVAKGTKIIEYYKNYTQKKTHYFINEEKEEFKTDFFLLATNQSPYGKLFNNDIYEQPLNPDGGRIKAIKYGVLPKKEFVQTFTFIRSLYKQWKKEERVHGIGLGILLSDLLNGGVGRPAIQGQVHYGWARIDRRPTWHEVFYVMEG